MCVCVWGGHVRMYFDGENANWTQRKPPHYTILGRTPTLSHKMMYPPTLVGVPGQICRSSEARGPPLLTRAPKPVPKSSISPKAPRNVCFGY